MTFLEALAEQRWDDHRFYHHSRINQSLHFFSAVSFLVAYALLFVDPAGAALLAWLFAMPVRQAGHFFFEPKTFDHVNRMSHAYKERIKVGYNLRRKVILLSIWALSPLLLLALPGPLGLSRGQVGWREAANAVGMTWLVVGIGGVLFRTVHLFFIRDVQTGLVWCTKILTDPFNDIRLYYRAPACVLRGDLLDPIEPHVT